MSKLQSILKEYILSNNVVCTFEQFPNKTTQCKQINTMSGVVLGDKVLSGDITQAEQVVSVPVNMIISVSYVFKYNDNMITAIYQGNNSYQLNLPRGVTFIQARNLNELIKIVNQYV